MRYSEFFDSQQRSAFWRLWLALGCALLCGLVILLQVTRPLDRLIYDTASRLHSDIAPDDLVIVAIDERSLLEFGRWPWPREKHVQLINQLAGAGVAAIAIDIIFSEPDIEYPQVDSLLAEAIANHGRVILPVYMGQTHRGGQLFEVSPLPALAEAAAGLGHVHIELDSDGIARSVFLREGLGNPHWNHFSVALLDMLQGPLGALPGVVNEDVLSQPSAISIIRSHKNYFPLRQVGSLETVSYADVLSGRIPARTLAGKIVFVGATAPGLGDNITTSLGQLSGVELNAEIFDALRSGTLITPATLPVLALLSMFYVGLALWFISRLEPREFLLATLLGIILAATASIAALLLLHRWATPVPAAITLVLAYPLWNWWRLEKAIAFLRHQLARLVEGQPAEKRHTPIADVVKGLQFLSALQVIGGWRIRQADGNEYEMGGEIQQPEAELADVPFDSQWQHRGKLSSCAVANGKGQPAYRVLVEWLDQDSHLREIMGEIVPVNGRAAQREPAVESEVVEQTIRQLSRAEQRVDAQRQMVDQSLSQLSSGVILAGFNGQCMLVNEQARHLLDVDFESGSLANFLDRIELHGSSWPLLLRELVFKGIGFSCEGSVSPGARDLLCHGSLVNISTPLMLFNIVDISDLKRSQQKRTDALNFLSHDLRAPLTSVLALIEGARTENPNEVNRLLLDNIEKYIQKNLSYAENYIHLAKLEATGASRLDDCEAHSLIDNAVAQIYHYAKSREVRLQPPEFNEERWVSCDRTLVERALVNLIDNAVKFSDAGAVVEIGLRNKHDHIAFSVTDRGPGIDSNELDSLFESFRQSGLHSGDRANAGVGLGLKFVAEVAAAHGGQVYVESHIGKGSTFFFTLPWQDAAIE